MKKNYKTLKASLTALMILYILAILFPQFLFANKLEYKGFEVYYHNNINEEKLKSVLDLSEELLSKSELYKKEETQELFITDSYREFTFFALLSRKAFAVNYPVVQNIFLTKSDLSKNIIIRNSDLHNKRSLSGVIAHETIHSLLENRLGTLEFKLLASWKVEGYADFIAKESSYSAADSLKTICDTDEDTASPSYKYFQYRLLTKYLLEKRNTGLDEFLTKEYELDQVKEKIKEEYCTS